MLAVFGSVALDTIRTAAKTNTKMLGGSATYAAIAASYFTKTGIIGLVGSDFPAKYRRTLGRHADLQGLRTIKGKTFHYDAVYDKHLGSRTTRKIEFGVTEKNHAVIPDSYRDARFVYLANNNPVRNIAILDETDARFTMCDTIDLWIKTQRAALVRMIKRTDATVINYEEARLLTKEHDIAQCAKKIASWGATYVIIKKDEHGAILYHGRDAYPYAALPARRFVDPTGAGDSFAGAIMGYLESKSSYGIRDMRRAIAHGIVLGSLAVERYGVDALLGKSKRELSSRMREYERVTRF